MPTPIHSVYEPLYLNDDKFIVLITGGRGSGKSYEVSRYIERLTFEQGQKILFSRYTMTSADKSIIPEVLEKIQGDGTSEYFNIKQDRIQNLRTQSEIIFMGIKASSGNQTAKLKSIQGLSTFVVDEAEEWVSPDEYEKLVLSLRQKGVKNTVIIVMNPSDTSHFIYQKYLKDSHRIVDYLGVPVQISTHPQVLHIHTTYQDNLRNLAPEFISTVEELRDTNPEKFSHVVAGQWSNQKKGLIFPHYEVIDELPHFLSQRAIGLDFGYTCFTGDTLIATMRGDVPIKDVKAGDFVLTRKGYRMVKKVMNNGAKVVINQYIYICGKKVKISCTPDHLFNVGKDLWKQSKDLAEWDQLCTILSSTEESTQGTQVESTQTIIYAKKGAAGLKSQGDSTETYTSSTRGRSLVGVMCTMLTKIQRITPQTISLQSQGRSTHIFIKTILKSIMRRIRLIKGAVALQRRTGVIGGRLCSKSSQARSGHVNGVERNTPRQTLIKDFARGSVITDGSIEQKRMTKHEFASAAERSSKEINTSSQNHVQKSVRISYQEVSGVERVSREKANVYDLEIDGVHEYFANGILVHNCDPSAAVLCGVHGNDLYLDELFYKRGMGYQDLIDALQQATEYDDLFVFADSAEPREIAEIYKGSRAQGKGINIFPVKKGAGSILAGLQKMQDLHIKVTRSSKNLRYELENYSWELDPLGEPTNKPVGKDDHAIDATRYYVWGQLFGQRKVERQCWTGI